MEMIVLNKDSDQNQIKLYFEKILELKNSGNEYPINLNLVWPLSYERKDHAVRDLKENFIQDVDYQVSLKNGENSNGGRPSAIYMLSVSCLEYLIVRKIRPVFEVYRNIFHKVSQGLLVPNFSNPAEAARAWAEQYEQRQLAEQKLIENKPKIDYFDHVAKTEDLKTIGEIAKLLNFEGVGRNKLYEILKERNRIMDNNEPYQKEVDAGYFKLIQKYDPDRDKTYCITGVTQKGIRRVKVTLESMGYKQNTKTK